MTQTQIQPTTQAPWRIHKDFYFFDGAFEGDAICPFCGHRLYPLDDDLECPSVDCPYLDPVIAQVVAALIGQGRDPLQAAQLAALYSAESEEPVTAERFEVTDYATADWVLRKLADYQRRRDAMTAMCDAEVERIEARRDAILRPINRQIEFFETAFRAELAQWARKELAGRKERSVKLLHGQLGYRKNPDAVEVLDEPAAIGMGEDLPELAGVVKVVKSISKTNAKRVLAELPECHPFRTAVAIKTGEDVFYIKAESVWCE